MSRLLRNGLILLALNAWVIVYLRTKPPVESTFRWKRTTMERHHADCDVLVLGSSHALYGIRPDYLTPHALNMALASQDTHYDWETLKKWGPELPRLKMVVQVLGPEMLLFELDNSCEEWRSDFYLAELNLPPGHWTIGRRLKSVLPRLAFDETATQQSPKMIAEFRRSVTDQGWFRTTPEVITREAAKLTVNRHRLDDQPAAISGNVLDRIQDVSNWCREHDVLCVYVNPPHHPFYREQTDPQKLRLCLKFLREVAKKNGALWIDEFASEAYGDGDYHDPDHLSEQGAAKLSRRVGEKIRPLL